MLVLKVTAAPLPWGEVSLAGVHPHSAKAAQKHKAQPRLNPAQKPVLLINQYAIRLPFWLNKCDI